MQKGSKFFISGEGMVYRVLSCKAVKRLWFGGDEEAPADCLDLSILTEQGSLEPLIFASDITEDNTFVIEVGSIYDILSERNNRFCTLECVAEYYRRERKLPWGIRGIMKANGWKAIPVSGCSLSIRDEATKKTLYVYGKTKEVYIEND